MTQFIMAKLDLNHEDAAKLRHSYYLKYGTTLRGLMVEHGLEPHPYLTYVHEIDYAAVKHEAQLAQALSNLPGRKLVFTAGTRAYMAPEQRETGQVDERSDIYQAGLLLLFATTSIDPAQFSIEKGIGE